MIDGVFKDLKNAKMSDPEIKGIIQLKQIIKENVWPSVCLVEDVFCFLSFFLLATF
jgi:hypothetical protein